MKGIYKMVKKMEKGNSHIMTDLIMMVSGRMINKMDMGFLV